MLGRFLRSKRHMKLGTAVVVASMWRRRPLVCALTVTAIVLAMLGRDRPTGGGDFDTYHDRVFTVVHVADGDTFDIELPDGQTSRTRIRLWGVDTPEVAGSPAGAMHYGAQASDFAKRTLNGRSVRVLLNSERTRDKYDRLLAYVTIEDAGESFNELLLEGGYAYADWRFPHPLENAYKLLEREARRNKVGLWTEITADQMPQWRQRMEREPEHQIP